MKMCVRKNGFTLVEVLLASMIGAFVVLVAVGTLRAISASAEMLENNISTSSEARFASKMIARDLMNLYRDKSIKMSRLVGLAEETNEGLVSCLSFYVVGRTKARIEEPEGDVYEVEYYLLKKEDKRALMRRLWPNPDKDSQSGGIMTAIAEDIDVFEVKYFDGEQWQIEWPEELKSLPELVEVTIVASRQGRADMVVESFIVNFPRAPWRKADISDDTEEEEKGESEK
jgi:general secretion pathway protein J